MGGWPDDPMQKRIGLYYQAAIDQDTEGYISFLANVMGWSRPQITVFAAHFKKEIKNNAIHSYYASRLVYGRKPVS